jgi:hypothetical protein
VVEKMAMGQVFVPVFLSSSISIIIPPVTNAHLLFNITLIKRTSGRSPSTSKQTESVIAGFIDTTGPSHFIRVSSNSNMPPALAN